MENDEKAAEVEAEAPEVQEPEVAPDAPAEAAEVEAESEDQPEHRFEKFEVTRPDGAVVVVERNIDTGEQTVTEKD